MRSEEMFAYVKGLEGQVQSLQSQLDRLRAAMAAEAKPTLTLPEKPAKVPAR
jgi:prefoldin subunit 5